MTKNSVSIEKSIYRSSQPSYMQATVRRYKGRDLYHNNISDNIAKDTF